MGHKKYISGYEGYPYSFQCNGTGIDSDGDNVHNGIDVDNDNDGVADTIECKGYPTGVQFNQPLGSSNAWIGKTKTSNVIVTAQYSGGTFEYSPRLATTLNPPYLIGNSPTLAEVTRGFKLDDRTAATYYNSGTRTGDGTLLVTINFSVPVPANEIALQVGDVDYSSIDVGRHPRCSVFVDGNTNISNYFEQAYINRDPAFVPAVGENYGQANLSTVFLPSQILRLGLMMDEKLS